MQCTHLAPNRNIYRLRVLKKFLTRDMTLRCAPPSFSIRVTSQHLEIVFFILAIQKRHEVHHLSLGEVGHVSGKYRMLRQERSNGSNGVELLVQSEEFSKVVISCVYGKRGDSITPCTPSNNLVQRFRVVPTLPLVPHPINVDFITESHQPLRGKHEGCHQADHFGRRES